MVWPEARLAAAGRAGRLRFPLDWPVAVIWALAAVGLLLLVRFDLSPPLAFNDDWMYAWSVRQLVAGHGLHVFPESTALALPQVVWGALLSLGHPDPRLLRLSVVPVVALTAWVSFLLARRLGADRFWSAVAATTLLAMPLFMANATSFMTDNIFVGIVMAVAFTGLGWASQGKWRWVCVGLLVLAPLERQVGLALIPAVMLGLLFVRRSGWTRADTAASVAMWALPAAAVFVAGRLVVSQPLYPIMNFSQLDVGHAIFPLAPMLGLGLIPFAAALALRPPIPNRDTVWSLGIAVLAVVGVVGCLVDLARFGMIFPGNVFSPLGFTATLAGSKPPIFPGPVFQAVEIAAVISFVMLLVVRRRWWTPRVLGPHGVVLILVSAAQFLPLLVVQWFIYDRYFLPVIAPLVPLVAAVASGAVRQPAARAWAAAALAGGLALYVIGEQDYVAWQGARDQAARLAYQLAPREQVQAGFEANAVYVELPNYERTGRADLFAILGPEHPRVILRFAAASDPATGVSYSSLNPGRIVLAQ